MILSNSRSLIEDIAFAKQKGYTEEFIYIDRKLRGRNNNKNYNAEECILDEYFLHEAMSDPSEQSILFLIDCVDGAKGCLSSAYGVYSDHDLIEFCISLKRKPESILNLKN